MDQTSKHNTAFKIAQEISNKLRKLKQNEFEYALSKFVEINDLLDKKKDFSKVQSDENNNDTTLKEQDKR